jgi:hypothetical protein
VSTDDDLRIRLEGGAELLDATLVRYRALVHALASFRWKEKVRRLGDVLREAARVQRRVDDVLALVQRRAQAEAWPEGPVLLTAHDVRALRSSLRDLVERRLDGDATHLLDEDFLELELRAFSSPRLVLPGQRWATACEVLPASLDELGPVRALWLALERAFGPPGDVTPERWTGVEAAWTAATPALARLWLRVERIDVTGGVGRSLRRRARLAPRFTAEQAATGPAALVTAEYWRAQATARIAHHVTALLAPARPREVELWPLFSWLVARAADPALSLAHAVLSPARAALLELALSLSGGAPGRAQHPFVRLRELASTADLDRADEDWRRLREALVLLVRVASASAKWLPPVHRDPAQAQPPRPDDDAPLLDLVQALESRLTQNKQ